jgi:hypothetical protein
MILKISLSLLELVHSTQNTTQNKNADSPSSNNLENVISKFLDDFKSMINPLLALLTTVISKLSIIKND